MVDRSSLSREWEKQPTEQEKIFVNDISDKGLISKTHKETLLAQPEKD